MRLLAQRKLSSLKPVLAGLLAGFVFLMTLTAASERLHLTLHADATHDQGHCVVCAIAKGHLDAPVVTVSETLVSMSVGWTLPSLQSVPLREVDFSVASSRGPPASVSSQS